MQIQINLVNKKRNKGVDCATSTTKDNMDLELNESFFDKNQIQTDFYNGDQDNSTSLKFNKKIKVHMKK